MKLQIRSIARVGTALLAASFSTVAATQGVTTIYVSPTGNDSNPGTLTLPKRTAWGAYSAYKAARAANSKDQFVIEFASGTYTVDRTLYFASNDSGLSSSKPTIIRGAVGAQVFLDGSAKVTGWQLVAGAAANRLVPAARPNVFQAPLPQWLGSSGMQTLDPGRFTRRGYPHETTETWSTLVFNSQPMKVARHPNEGWFRVPANHTGSNQTFGMTDPVPYGWVNGGDIWAHGFFGWDWADSFERVASFNSGPQTVTLAETPAYGIQPTQRYYLVNALEALDAPYEFFVDRGTSTVYFYPPLAGFTDAQKIASLNAGSFLTAHDAPLVAMWDARDITFENITFQNGRRGAVTVQHGARVQFKGCGFRRFSTQAVFVGSGFDHLFLSCDFYDLDEGALQIIGGDRATLAPAGHQVVNCWFRDYGKVCMAYRVGVDLWGVGHRVSNCRIEDAPHGGLVFHGNDHLVEYTDFKRLCLETIDAGAVYLGRDFTFQGNRVYYNRFRDIKSHQIGTHSNFATAVFLDDMASGTEIAMNIFDDVQIGVIVGGGRDNKLDNNYFFNTPKAVQFDARGTSWASNFWIEWDVPSMLNAVPYKSTLWRSRYPYLYNIDRDQPAIPKRNDLTRSVHVGGTNWLTLHDGLQYDTNRRKENYSIYCYFNSVTLGDPGFTNMPAGVYTYDPMSWLAWAKIKTIYPQEIGLFLDQYRTSLP